MKIYYLFFGLILSFVLISCEDAFTTVKEIDIPEHEKKLALFANFSESEGSFFVSHSKNISDNGNYENVNATITVFENGIEFLKFDYSGNNSEGWEEKKFVKNMAEGNEYTLIVKNDKYGTATSKQTLPKKPDISNIKYKKDGFIDPDGYKSDQLSFNINDEKNIENYYMIEAMYLSIYEQDTFENNIYFESNDPSTRSAYFNDVTGLIVSDKIFDGTNPKLILGVDNYDFFDNISLKISAITKDYYNFLLSYDQYSNSNGNPFAEPVNVHNNIENGYGLFQVSNPSNFLVEIE